VQLHHLICCKAHSCCRHAQKLASDTLPIRGKAPPTAPASVCRDTVPYGAVALLAGRALGVDAWGHFHWDFGDVMRDIITAAPLGFICEQMH
jgi:hypothetical protein